MSDASDWHPQEYADQLVLEIQGLILQIKDKDAEIERLAKELAHETDMAAQADMFVNRYRALIIELVDALEIHSSIYQGAPIEKLIQKAREAVTI